MVSRTMAYRASRWDEVDGVRMHARVAGRSGQDPLVLVHGLGVSSRYLLPVADRLSDWYTAFAPDLPGFGRTPPAAAARSVGGLARALGSWLDAVGIRAAPLLASSFGCQVAVELAVSRPRLVSALVLTGPTVDPDARSFVRQAGRLVLDATREPAGMVALAASEYTGFLARGGLALAWAALADPIERKLPTVRQPTLVVRGSRDPIAPQDWAKAVASAIPRAELRVVARAPHALPYAAPGELARLVRAFLVERKASVS
jgi:pimeloyl-ACP methyl ester carboxylesterase